jgi:hypothetical protein
MQSARASGTNERLEVLSDRVDRGFDRIDQDVRELRADMKDMRADIKLGFDALSGSIKIGDDSLREEINARFGEFDTRFGRMERTIYGFGGIVIAAFLAAYLSGGV